MRTSRQTYKHKNGKPVRVTSTFKLCNTVLVDKPLLSAIATHSENAMADTSYNKLLTQLLEPFRVIPAQPHTLTIDENGSSNTNSVSCTRHAQTRARQHTASDDSKIQTRDSDKDTFKHARPKQVNTADDSAWKYTVQHIVRQFGSRKHLISHWVVWLRSKRRHRSLYVTWLEATRINTVSLHYSLLATPDTQITESTNVTFSRNTHSITGTKYSMMYYRNAPLSDHIPTYHWRTHTLS